MFLNGIARPFGFAASVVVIICGLVACSSDDDKDDTTSSSGSSSNGSNNGSNNGSSGAKASGGCTGEITSCAMGTLSDAQMADMCSLFLAAIDVPPGTKFECGEGPNKGLFITMNTKEQCTQQRPPAACTVTVGAMVDCFKAAKADACAAFDGACSILFDKSNGCLP